MIVLTAALALPLGVAAAVYLEEYGTQSRARAPHRDQHRQPGGGAVHHLRPARPGRVRAVHGHGPKRAGGRVHAGAAGAAGGHPVDARGAAHGAPARIREGSYALGATKWQTIWHQVLPMALPGILTGLILSLSRAIGETAPLITIGALTYIPFAPGRPLVAVHGAADSDLQLGLASPGGVQGERRRRHPGAAAAAARHERRRGILARPLPAPGSFMSVVTPSAPSLAGIAARRGQTPVRTDAPVKIDVDGMNFYYGAKRALDGISIRIHANLVTAFIGPSGCGKSTFLRTLNRMNDIIPGDARRGHGPHRRRGHLRPRRGRRRAAPAGRDGVPEVEPVPEVHLRERRLRPAHQRHGADQGRARTIASRRASSRPPSSTRSRTGCTSRRWRSRAASSSGCASPARWPSGPRSC